MSYSVCINCREMVPAYEKYCERCLRRYRLPQDELFHRTNQGPPTGWAAIVASDKALEGGIIQ